MGVLILLAAAGVVALWWSGRLKGLTYEDAAAGIVFLLGLRLLTTGRLIPGGALMAGSLLWAAWRRGQAGKSAEMPVGEARQLLGVLADRCVVVADDILGERVGELVPVLGVKSAQVPVFHSLDLVDVTHGRHCSTRTKPDRR